MPDVKRLMLQRIDIVIGLKVHVGEEDDVEGGLAKLPTGDAFVPARVRAAVDGQTKHAERSFVLVREELFERIEHDASKDWRRSFPLSRQLSHRALKPRPPVRSVGAFLISLFGAGV